MKKFALRSISFIVAAVVSVVPVAGPLSWLSNSPEIPQELKDKWNQ
jgi:hypothetical protein